VSDVTNFGLFVELSELYIEGLVHITSLPGDYYRFDHAQQRLVGERTGRSYRLGARLQVLVAAVNLDEKKIDLEPVGDAQTRTRGAGQKIGKKAGKKAGKKRDKKHGSKPRGDTRKQKDREDRKSTGGSSSSKHALDSHQTERAPKTTRRKTDKRKNGRSASAGRATGGARGKRSRG